MKKILFTILAITMISFTKIEAQEVKFGIKGGLNLADWRGQAASTISDVLNLTNVLETQIKPGFHLGSFVNIPVGNNVIIEPGLYYSQKGIEVRADLPNSLPGIVEILNIEGTVKNKAHYIDMPILVKFFPTEGFNVFAGTQFSYLVENKINVQAGAFGIDVVNRDIDINAGFRKFDVAMVAGLGYQFTNGISINGSFDLGLTSLDDRGNFDAYNQVGKISIGYTF